MHCWGYNYSGQLGDGTTTNRTTAVATLGLTNRIWDRLAGADRYATAAAVSRSAFPTGGAGAVVLARGDAYPDALVGVPLAAARHAPLLLTHGSSLPPVTLTEIRRVLPVGGTVYVLGGTDVVPASIGTQLTGLGYQITRYAGADRFGTAVAVADALGDPPPCCWRPGWTSPTPWPPDPRPPPSTAWCCSPPARPCRRPPPRTWPRTPAPCMRSADRPPPPTPPPGRWSARTGTPPPPPSPPRSSPPRPPSGIATGLNFPDALAGAAQLATAGGPLLLTTTTVLPAATGSELTAVKASVGTTHFYGQIDVVADPVALAAAASLGY